MQLVRKARLGCDAILPGGTASALWQSDELFDLATQANDDLNLRLRLVRKKYGLVTIDTTTPDFTRDGVTYSPATSLAVANGATEITLPPDFAEVSKILCTNDTTVRFKPGETESQYWIDDEQNARWELDSNFTASGQQAGGTYFYEPVGERTLAITPPVAQSLELSLSYIPALRPLYYSNTGTVSLTHGSVIVNGTETQWQSDGVYAAADGQACELIVGTASLSATTIRLDRDYPRVQRIGSDLQLELVSAYAGATVSGSSFILAMVPTLPKVYHRWIADLMSALMLRKVNPDLADKYAASVMKAFTEVVRPTAGVRQSQESRVTDDNETLGGLVE